MNYNDNLRINKALKKRMIDKNIKAGQVAAATRKSNQSISNLLNNQANLTINTISEIADALGCDVCMSFVDRETGEKIEC